jgi:hypothetical protein
MGRSNVGKSTLGQILTDQRLVVHRDLDDLLRRLYQGHRLITVTQDWQIVGPLLEELDGQDREPRILVSLGAGTQDGDRYRGDRKLEVWLSERRHRVVLVDGAKDELRERYTGSIRDFEVLEYGLDRQRLHQVADHVVDVSGLTPDLAAHRLQSLLLGLAEQDSVSESGLCQTPTERD